MSEAFRVMLINAINPRVESETRYPHLGLGYLVAQARKQLPEAKIEFKLVQKNVLAEAKKFQPHLIGVSSVSQNFNLAKKYIQHFTDQGHTVLVGGIHISVLPQNLPAQAVACLGESEETFTQVIQAALSGSWPKARREIPGLAFHKGEKLHLTPRRPLLVDMDLLPWPARDLMNVTSHTYMFTSRGCPYRCAFCASSRYWDQVRFFSAEYVVAEIQMLLKDYRVNFISFFDDLFAAHRARLEEIVRLLDRRRLLGLVRFTMNCRANVVDAELAGLLKRLGVVSVGLGLESGDEATLKYLKSGSVSVEQNRTAVNHLKNAGIAANASFVIGSPLETQAQIMKTYEFILRSRLDLFDIYLLTPFPGTPVWEYARTRGLVSDDMDDWSRLDVNSYRALDRAIILSEVLSPKEMINFYKKFRNLRFRWNLKQVWRHPLRVDVPKMAWKLAADRLSRLVR